MPIFNYCQECKLIYSKRKRECKQCTGPLKTTGIGHTNLIFVGIAILILGGIPVVVLDPMLFPYSFSFMIFMFFWGGIIFYIDNRKIKRKVLDMIEDDSIEKYTAEYKEMQSHLPHVDTIEFEVGDWEKHNVKFEFDKVANESSVSVDNLFLMRKSYNNKLIKNRKIHFSVGDEELHDITIESKLLKNDFTPGEHIISIDGMPFYQSEE